MRGDSLQESTGGARDTEGQQGGEESPPTPPRRSSGLQGEGAVGVVCPSLKELFYHCYC